MAVFTLDSLPDSGRFTRISIESTTGTITGIELRSVQPPGPLFSLPLSSSSTDVSKANLFSIQFTKFDLTAPAKNNNFLGAVEYKIKVLNNPPVNATGSSLSLTYTIGAQLFQPELSIPQLLPFENITVTITFRRSPDVGWIDLDLQFTYPTQIGSPDTAAATAWETRVIYPELLFDNGAMNGYTILNPAGNVWSFAQVAAANAAFTMPVQFAALYKLGRNISTGINSAAGVAFSATDENGHQKELHYQPQGVSTNVNFQLRGPIHLLQQKFVRPTNPATFVLSGGDDQGFGGARMTYRIRAFQLDGLWRDAPVDWFDVADLYRNWVRTRTATIFRKQNSSRQTDAPIDNMSPHTVVLNYSLDGPVSPQDDPTNLPKWLEVHPIILPPALGGGGPDVPGNTNESLQAILIRLRSLFGSPSVRLEGQVWGYETFGYYRFLGGLPPLTNLLNPSPNSTRFKNAMQDLVNNNIIPIITTDPLKPNFDRLRFRGHLTLGATGEWGPFILARFPTALTNAVRGRVITTTNPTATDSGNRVCLIDPGYDTANLMKSQTKRDAQGNQLIEKDVLTRFYGLQQHQLCPTQTVENVYLNQWLSSGNLVTDPGGVLDHGARLIEFMKHLYLFHFCYDKGHTHLSQPTTAYDNVMGCGPWYIKRLQHMLTGAHAVGQTVYSSFALCNEFIFPETLVPYFDEFYDRISSSNVFQGDSRSLELLQQAGQSGIARTIPFFRYVYSEKVSEKMDLIDIDALNHPGYKEVRWNPTTPPVAEPAYMLDPVRDTESLPTFATWLQQSQSYYAAFFNVNATQHGVAPTGYPSNQGGTYTYTRCLQEVMNLRSKIFHIGAGAVVGERIFVPTAWVEPPYDFNVELINMAAHAVHMQMFFTPYFRLGYMLGPTHILSGNSSVSAWRINIRGFTDVQPLVDQLNNPRDIIDVISRGTDRESFATPITTDRIQHMVWQTHALSNQTRTLYVFGNVGNSDQVVQFVYTRGFTGTTLLHRIIRTFSGDPNPAASPSRDVKLGDTETISIPKRGLVGVVVFP